MGQHQFLQVERRTLGGQWLPIDQEDLRAIVAVYSPTKMAHVNAVRSYAPRPRLGGQRAVLLLEHARTLAEILSRWRTTTVRIVCVTVTEEVVT